MDSVPHKINNTKEERTDEIVSEDCQKVEISSWKENTLSADEQDDTQIPKERKSKVKSRRESLKKSNNQEENEDGVKNAATNEVEEIMDSSSHPLTLNALKESEALPSDAKEEGLFREIEMLKTQNAQLQSDLAQSQDALRDLKNKQQVWKEKAIATTQKDRQCIRELQNELGALEARRVNEQESLETNLQEVSHHRDELVRQLSEKENNFALQLATLKREKEESIKLVGAIKEESSVWKKEADGKSEEITLLKKSFEFLEKKSAAALADRKEEIIKRKEFEEKVSALEEVVQGLNTRLVTITEEKEKCMNLVREKDAAVMGLQEKLELMEEKKKGQVASEVQRREKETAILLKKIEQVEETEKKSREELITIAKEKKKIEEEMAALQNALKTLKAEKEEVEKQEQVTHDKLNEERHISKERKEKLEQLQEKTRLWKEKVVAKSQAEGEKMAFMEEVIETVSTALKQLYYEVQELEKKSSFERIFTPLAEEVVTRVEPMMIFQSLFHPPHVNVGALIQARQTLRSSASGAGKEEQGAGVGNDLAICLSCVVDCGREVLEKCFVALRTGYETKVKLTDCERRLQLEQRQRHDLEMTIKSAHSSLEEVEKKYQLLQQELEGVKRASSSMSAQFKEDASKKTEEALRHAEAEWLEKKEAMRQVLESTKVQHRAQLQQLESRCQLLQKEMRQLKKATERSSQSFVSSPPFEMKENLQKREIHEGYGDGRKMLSDRPSHSPSSDGIQRSGIPFSGRSSFQLGGEVDERGQDGAEGSHTPTSLGSSVIGGGGGDPSSTRSSSACTGSGAMKYGERGVEEEAVHHSRTSQSYMRNIIYQYLSSPDPVRAKMIPAIVTVLGFNSVEKRAIASANPSCPTLR